MENDAHQPRGWMSRALGVVTATALALGTVAAFPIAAQAATTTAKITGTVNFAANKSWSVGDKKYKGSTSGNISVYDAKCNWVSGVTVKWNGKKFTATVPKGGKYKIAYYDYTQRKSAKSPYGFAEAWRGGAASCTSSKAVSVSNGKSVKAGAIVLKSSGKVTVTGVTPKQTSKYYERVAFTPVGSKTAVAAIYSGDLYVAPSPGKYRISLERVTNGKTKTLKVFGTSSKKVSKGKTITVTSAKALSVNFKKKKAVTVKDFSYKLKVKLSGSKKVGGKLTAKLSGAKLPKGTKVSYRWGAGKFTKSNKYTVKSSHGASWISVTVKLTKSGYSTGGVWTGTYIIGKKLVQTVPQGLTTDSATPLNQIDAESYDGAQTGSTLSVVGAKFGSVSVYASSDWYVFQDGYWQYYAYSSSIFLNEDLAGKSLKVITYYSATGYESTSKTSFVAVAPALGGGTTAPPTLSNPSDAADAPTVGPQSRLELAEVF